MRQEQDEGKSDEDENQEEKGARKKPAKRLWQELDKEEDKGMVSGGKMMTGIEFTGMAGIGFVDLSGIETVRQDASSND
jgi:hypothetical protein